MKNYIKIFFKKIFNFFSRFILVILKKRNFIKEKLYNKNIFLKDLFNNETYVGVVIWEDIEWS